MLPVARGRKADIRALDGALSKAPPAPAWLPPHGRAEWRRVLPTLVKQRKIASNELGVVESYCVAVANMRAAQARIDEDGHFITSPTSGELKRHPATTLLKEAIESARRLAAELGITPASRNKNEGGAPGDDSDDLPPGMAL